MAFLASGQPGRGSLCRAEVGRFTGPEESRGVFSTRLRANGPASRSPPPEPRRPRFLRPGLSPSHGKGSTPHPSLDEFRVLAHRPC